MFRPFRARVSVWVPLTQAFSLGRKKVPDPIFPPRFAHTNGREGVRFDLG